MSELKINSNNGFLQMEDLPQNCIFNKVVTGCGGTTIALFNNKNQIIAVPTTELITNKTGLTEAGEAIITSPDGIKTQSVFGLFGEFTYGVQKELKQYVASPGTKKILCTYDKVGQLVRFIEPQYYQILIDEYHQLLKAYSYRSDAIKGVLENFKRFKSFCFLSATPISPDFTPSPLDGVEQIDAVWENTDTLFVKLEQTNNPYVRAANIINCYKTDGFITINDERSYEAFFFINSVTDIAAILKHCNLSNDEVKIVCADNEPNRKKLEGYTISNSRSANKKFTFITSKSFEGADYFSETGLCFVVSNSRNKNTLLDISTDIYQIAGRIRTETNPFRNMLVHIFNTAGKRKLNLDITYDEYKQVIQNKIKGANIIINAINADANAKAAAGQILKNEYIMKDENDSYFFNDTLVKLDLMLYKIEKEIYQTGLKLKRSYDTNGILTTEPDYKKVDNTIDRASKKIPFKEAYLKYSELRKSLDFGNSAVEIAAVQPLVVDAYNKLGDDKVKKLRYIKKDIEKALINCDNNKSQLEKVGAMLMKSITCPTVETCSRLKHLIGEAYRAVGIKEEAKASDIENWFKCKKTSARIEGITTAVYKIYTPELKYD